MNTDCFNHAVTHYDLYLFDFWLFDFAAMCANTPWCWQKALDVAPAHGTADLRIINASPCGVHANVGALFNEVIPVSHVSYCRQFVVVFMQLLRNCLHVHVTCTYILCRCGYLADWCCRIMTVSYNCDVDAHTQTCTCPSVIYAGGVANDTVVSIL